MWERQVLCHPLCENDDKEDCDGEVGVDEDDMLMVIMMIVAKDEISVRRFTWALAGCGWVRRDAQSSFC